MVFSVYDPIYLMMFLDPPDHSFTNTLSISNKKPKDQEQKGTFFLSDLGPFNNKKQGSESEKNNPPGFKQKAPSCFCVFL